MRQRLGKRVCSVTCRVRKMEAFRFFDRTIEALTIAAKFAEQPSPGSGYYARKRWAINHKAASVPDHLRRAFHYWRLGQEQDFDERYKHALTEGV